MCCCCFSADVCYSNEGLDLLVPTLLELCAVAPRVTIWFAQVRRSAVAVARRKSRDSSRRWAVFVKRASASFRVFGRAPPPLLGLSNTCELRSESDEHSQDKECVPGGARIADRFFETLLPAAGFCVHCHPSEQLLSREWSDPDVLFYRVTFNAPQHSPCEAPPLSAPSPMVLL